MKMLLWIWILAPWFFALLSPGLACVLTEILRLRTARNRRNNRDDVSLLTGGLADEIDCFFDSYMASGGVSQLPPETRRAVILAYTTARSMLDGLAAHTSLLEKHEALSPTGTEGSADNILLQRLTENTRQLKVLHEMICAVTEQALAQLRQGDVR
ncbi:hypothetical protein DQK32_23305 [Salmonella enterica subsp. enterica serovar Newport]|uniref:Uncharacterized protein n=1 Tax=Salmonella newport TaxID=108619 RepID=A0A5U9VWL8_SALNE|nr:hypothetical protein [Salmonella enterica subsp. enterica serovar Newport]MDJ6542832.1 hypothetical protein [Salmonella enterica]MDJ7048601.1 hypothetical protein [Salmonella enterica]MDJ7337539.1 hypothetical protein [Salmonella enterica]